MFALVLLVFGKNPLRAYVDIFASTLGSWYGFSETIVKMIPLVLAAVAVAVPGQNLADQRGRRRPALHRRSLRDVGGARHSATGRAWLLLPLMAALGFLGGGLWAASSGLLRARGWVSETISTLLLNYVAILLVSFFVFGPWKDPEGVNYPQTAEFVPCRDPADARDDAASISGLVFALVGRARCSRSCCARTRWGLEMRAIGGNAEAARRTGIPIGRYVVVLMFVGGGLAGPRRAWARSPRSRAGSGRACRPGTATRASSSAGWRAAIPLGIVAASFLLAVITAGGDILQMTQALPGLGGRTS